ncbi:Ig-like domain-containing protein [Aliagarivorans taiwanensis]|uniref:Ig-like domain-containing protein n=1 Tax=Aliagarivorans taiwanensis TaxID=561966 RepID=UPI0004105D9F|nr:Ig-like domain-containing protein [Aliagarivorans taiwanensis]
MFQQRFLLYVVFVVAFALTGCGGSGAEEELARETHRQVDEMSVVTLRAEDGTDYMWQQLDGHAVTAERWDGQSLTFIAPETNSELVLRFAVDVDGVRQLFDVTVLPILEGWIVDDPIASASVQVFGADGVLLGDTTSDLSGFYSFHGITASDLVRVVVESGSGITRDGRHFDAELEAVCDINSQERFACYVTPMSTLLTKVIDEDENLNSPHEAKSELTEWLGVETLADLFVEDQGNTEINILSAQKARVVIGHGEGLDDWIAGVLAYAAALGQGVAPSDTLQTWFEQGRVTGEPLLVANSITKHIDADPFVLSVDGGHGGQRSYKSANPDVATIDENGRVRIVGGGHSVLEVSEASTMYFEPQTALVGLIVTRPNNVPLYFQTSMQTVSAVDQNLQFLPTGGNGGRLRFESSSPEVAQVDQHGNIRVIKAGKATITAFEEASLGFDAQSASYVLNVLPAERNTLYFDQNEVNLTLDTDTYHQAVNGTNDETSVYYESSNLRVATVSADGRVSVTGAGVTVISAIEAQTDVYARQIASYRLYVSSSLGHELSMSCPENLHLNGPDFYPQVIGGNGGLLSFSVPENNAVVSVTPEGRVTILGVGTVNLQVSEAAQGGYLAQSAQCQIVVSRQNSATVSIDSIPQKTVGDAPFTLTFSGGHEGQRSYTSSNANVAGIDEQGQVTLYGSGEVTLSVYLAATDTFNSQEAHYSLTVSKGVGNGLSLVLPDSVSVDSSPFSLLVKGAHDGALSYHSTNPQVASISGGGEVTVHNAGNTTFEVTQQESNNFLAQSQSITLRVNKGSGQPLSIMPLGELTIDSGSFNLKVLGGNGAQKRYSSSDTSVARVEASGMVSIHGVGAVTLQVSEAESANYKPQKAELTVHIGKGRGNPLSFICPAATALQSYTLQAVGGNGGQISYSIPTETRVASVSGHTLSALAFGEVAITASEATSDDYMGQSVSCTLSVARADASPLTITALTGITVDSAAQQIMTNGGSHSDIRFSGDRDEIATVSANGVVTINGSGSVIITATQTENEIYKGQTVTYTLEIAKGQGQPPTLTAVEGLTFDSPQTFTQQASSGNGGNLSFESSHSDVAQIDAATGQVTILKAGSSTITVTEQESTNYLARSASYELIIAKGQGQSIEISLPSVPFDYSHNTFSFVVTVDHGNNGTLTFSSSDEDVATIEPSFWGGGALLIVGVGQTTLTVTEEHESYHTQSATHLLTVAKAPGIKPTFTELTGLSYEDKGKSFTQQASSQTGGSLSFASSNQAVASFISGTNQLKINGGGDTTITVSDDGGANYEAREAGYVLSVAKIQGAAPSVIPLIGLSYDDLYQTFVQSASASNGGTLLYFSHSPKVVTVDRVTGELTVRGIGTASMEIVETATDDYDASSLKYEITVAKGQGQPPALTPLSGLSVDDRNDEHTQQASAGNGESLSFSSSNQDVARIDAQSGIIQILKAGDTQITVTEQEGQYYLARDASYMLNIAKGSGNPLELSCPYAVETEIHTLHASGGNDGTITYSVPHPNDVAQISGKQITALTPGAVVVTAHEAESDSYHAQSAQCEFIVYAAGSEDLSINALSGISVDSEPVQLTTRGGNGAEVSFSTDSDWYASLDSDGLLTTHHAGTVVITASQGQSGVYPAESATYTLEVAKGEGTKLVIDDPGKLTLNSNGFVLWTEGNLSRTARSYISSDPSVVTINDKAWVVIQGAGQALITVTEPESDDYKAQEASISLVVEAVPRVLSVFTAGYGVAAALHDDGSLTTWQDGYGNFESADSSGSAVNSVSGTFNPDNPVISVTPSYDAFAALHQDGSVTCWGDEDYGGDCSATVVDASSSAVGVVNPVMAIYTTGSAFAALHRNGAVTAWGDKDDGGDCRAECSKLIGADPVVVIHSNRDAFAALHASGSVTTWGDDARGGNSSDTAVDASSALFTSPVRAIYSTYGAFSALHANGSVTSWGFGRAADNDDMWDAVQSSTDVNHDTTNNPAIELYSMNGGVFAAVHKNGAITSWGNIPDFLSTQSKDTAVDQGHDDFDSENPVIDVRTVKGEFAALHNDGSVTLWGGRNYATSRESVQKRLDDSGPVVTIYSSSNAFAALHVDGKVTAWNEWGIESTLNSSGVNSEDRPPVVSIYLSDYASAALHRDGSVSTWGNSYYGGDSSGTSVGAPGDNPVTAIYPLKSGFVAIHKDGALSIWGAGPEMSPEVAERLGRAFDALSASGDRDATGNGISINDAIDGCEPPYLIIGLQPCLDPGRLDSNGDGISDRHYSLVEGGGATAVYSHAGDCLPDMDADCDPRRPKQRRPNEEYDRLGFVEDWVLPANERNVPLFE